MTAFQERLRRIHPSLLLAILPAIVILLPFHFTSGFPETNSGNTLDVVQLLVLFFSLLGNIFLVPFVWGGYMGFLLARPTQKRLWATVLLYVLLRLLVIIVGYGLQSDWKAVTTMLGLEAALRLAGGLLGGNERAGNLHGRDPRKTGLGKT